MKTAVRRFVVISCVGVGVFVVGACSRNNRSDHESERAAAPQAQRGAEEQGATTTVTGARVSSNQAALDRIVTARCAREATCHNIGADKHYASTQACTDKIKADMADDLNAKDCPYGVDEKELDGCLAAIRKEDCGNPIDAISRLAACRTSDMCLKTAVAPAPAK